MKGPSFLVLLGISVVLVGCGDEGARPSFEVRDSAGIEIVESYGPSWPEGSEWQLGAEPLLKIGVVEGAVAYQFDGVTGGATLPNGAVVVADFGYQNVRFFDSQGGHITTFGGPGEGPGEFQGLAGMGLGADGRIWCYDFMLRRITWLNYLGEMVGQTRLGPEPAMLQALGPLPDGTFLLKQLWGASKVAEATETGLRRDDVAFVRFDPQGALVDTLGLFPGREVYLLDENGRGVMSTPPFPKNTMGAVWRGRAVVGSNEAFDLREYSAVGGVERIVRLGGFDLTLGPEDREDYVLGRLEGAPEERRPGLRNELESMPFPETRPAFGGLLPDQAGNLWVGSWALTPQVSERWTVLDSSGRWLGTVGVPPRFSPMQIGEDWILGVEWDDLDVEYVVLYPLLKG